MKATIDASMIKTGSPAKHSIIPPGFINGKSRKIGGEGHARGHLLANELGGSGSNPNNLVTLYQNPTNTPNMKKIEDNVRKIVESGEVVEYSVTPIYNGTNPIPTHVHIVAINAKTKQVYHNERIKNRHY